MAATVTPAAQSCTATSIGYVTDGTGLLDCHAAITASATSVTVDISKFSLDSDGDAVADASATTHETVTINAPQQTAMVAFLFTFLGSGQSVSAGGTVNAATVQQVTTLTLDIVMKVGGETYATLTGTFASPVLKDYKGQPITDTTIQQALGGVFEAAGAVGDEVANISAPALDLLPGGHSVSPGF